VDFYVYLIILNYFLVNHLQNQIIDDFVDKVPPLEGFIKQKYQMVVVIFYISYI